jgi:23S rRNA pseudouridine2605 synthase
MVRRKPAKKEKESSLAPSITTGDSRSRSGIQKRRAPRILSAAEKAAALLHDPMRIQKFLANAGIASRRTIEEWIKAGKVEVNGKVAILGQSVSAKDTIKVDGRALRLKAFDEQETRVLLYHKAEGELCAARTENGKPTVFANLPSVRGSKWVMVGRLDINTSGLLLFTNNGTMSHHLMHPSFAHERHYAVRVLGKVTEEALEQLRTGVRLEDGVFCFKTVTFSGGTGANQWYTVSLEEGKYREVRRLWESQGCKVSRLIRIQYGPFALPPGLRKSKCYELPAEEVTALLGSMN